VKKVAHTYNTDQVRKGTAKKRL